MGKISPGIWFRIERRWMIISFKEPDQAILGIQLGFESSLLFSEKNQKREHCEGIFVTVQKYPEKISQNSRGKKC